MTRPKLTRSSPTETTRHNTQWKRESYHGNGNHGPQNLRRKPKICLHQKLIHKRRNRRSLSNEDEWEPFYVLLHQTVHIKMIKYTT